MARPQGKLVRLLASRLEGDDCNLYCLQDGFVNVLLDLAERLEWDATWLDDDLETRSILSDAQKQKIEQGLEALTMACTVEIINNVEIVPPEVTVNVNGGGGTTTTCLPFPLPDPVRPDGTVIDTVCLPVDPENPSGEYPVQVVDEENLIPPDGWPDWNSFIDEKCRAANYMVDALIGAVNSIDEAENRASVALEVVQLFIQFAPESIQKTTPWIKFIKLVDKYATFVSALEGLWDFAQEVVNIIEDLRNDIVCILYSAPDVLFAASSIVAAVAAPLTLSMTAQSIDPTLITAVNDFWETLVNEIVPRAYDYEFVLSIPDGYQPPYNCSACGGGGIGGDWLIVPVTFNQIEAFGGDGGVTDHDVTNLGAYLRLSADCDSPGDLARYQMLFDCPEAAGYNVYGFHLDIDNLVNVGRAGHDNSSAPLGILLNECSNLFDPPVPLWSVRSDVATFELETGISTNVGSACPPDVFAADGSEQYTFRVQAESVISGRFGVDIKLFLICRDNVV